VEPARSAVNKLTAAKVFNSEINLYNTLTDRKDMKKKFTILLATLFLGYFAIHESAIAQTITTSFPSTTTLYKDSSGTYADTQYGPPPTTPGLMIQFNGKFEDASHTDEVPQSAFLEDKPQKKTQRTYIWPANLDSFEANFYSKGKVVKTSDRNGLWGHATTQDIDCFLIVTADPASTPPDHFPSVQIHTVDPRNNEMMDEDNKSYIPKRYKHELWLNFKGGEVICQVWDKNSSKSWSLNEVTATFGDSLLSFSQPSTSSSASAAQLNHNYSSPQQKVTTEANKAPLPAPAPISPTKNSETDSTQRGI
jgi:hypothetical protein